MFKKAFVYAGRIFPKFGAQKLPYRLTFTLWQQYAIAGSPNTNAWEYENALLYNSKCDLGEIEEE